MNSRDTAQSLLAHVRRLFVQLSLSLSVCVCVCTRSDESTSVGVARRLKVHVVGVVDVS